MDSLLEKVKKGEAGGSVTVDSSLSTTSENPVMNKAITGELNKKATKEELAELSEKKVDKEEGKGLSTNDYTDEDKTKVGFIGLKIGNQGELLDNFLLVLEEAHSQRPQCGPCKFYIGDQIVCGIYFMNDANPPDGGVDEFVIFSQDFSETEAQGYASLYIMGISRWGSDVDISIKKRINLSDLSFDIATQSEIDALFEGSSTGGSSTSY